MLLMTDNDEFLEPAAQRAALFLLSACVCRPLEGKKDVYLETNVSPASLFYCATHSLPSLAVSDVLS